MTESAKSSFFQLLMQLLGLSKNSTKPSEAQKVSDPQGAEPLDSKKLTIDSSEPSVAQAIIRDVPIVDSKHQEMKALKKRLMVFEAKKWDGVREIGGANRGQIVEMFQKTVDGKAQGEPWCAAFCSFVIKTVDDTFIALGLDSEKSPLVLSEHVMTLWAKAPDSAKTKTPEAGSLVVWQLYKDGKATSNGHIGIVASVLSDSEISTIEGNTNDGTGVERDGVGVFHRTRSIKGAGSMKVVGFIKPWC